MEYKNFWQKLKRPFFCLAPMSDVTDNAFRAILAKYSKRSENKNSVVFWTEFVAADGLAHKFARKNLSYILDYSEAERPIVAQVFGANPEKMKIACQYIASLNFDGIDINMGCPDRSVIDQGAGSALIKTPKLTREIIQAAREGIAATGQHIPISVKTRIGFNQEEIDTWLPELLKENLSALTVHLRTKKEESLVPAHWDLMERIIKLRDKISPETLIIGNGDVKDLTEAKEKAEKYKCDGVMIGRGVFGKPDFFRTTPSADCHPSLEKEGKVEGDREPRPGLGYSQSQALVLKIDILKEHIKLFDKKLLQPGHKSFAVMKKHFKAYLNDFDGAKELRNRLMDTERPSEALSILSTFQRTLK